MNIYAGHFKDWLKSNKINCYFSSKAPKRSLSINLSPQKTLNVVISDLDKQAPLQPHISPFYTATEVRQLYRLIQEKKLKVNDDCEQTLSRAIDSCVDDYDLEMFCIFAGSKYEREWLKYQDSYRLYYKSTKRNRFHCPKLPEELEKHMVEVRGFSPSPLPSPQYLFSFKHTKSIQDIIQENLIDLKYKLLNGERCDLFLNPRTPTKALYLPSKLIDSKCKSFQQRLAAKRYQSTSSISTQKGDEELPLNCAKGEPRSLSLEGDVGYNSKDEWKIKQEHIRQEHIRAQLEILYKKIERIETMDGTKPSTGKLVCLDYFDLHLYVTFEGSPFQKEWMQWREKYWAWFSPTKDSAVTSNIPYPTVPLDLMSHYLQHKLPDKEYPRLRKYADIVNLVS